MYDLHLEGYFYQIKTKRIRTFGSSKIYMSKEQFSSMADYLKNFKLVRDRLNAIGVTIFDEDKTLILSNGLGLDYENFTTMQATCSFF